MMHYPYIASRVFNSPLMIHPGKLHAIVAGLSERFGVVAPPAPLAYTTPTGTREQGGYRLLSNGVAVLDVFGILAHRTALQADSSFVQGYEGLARALDAALQDSAARALLLNIDSPGGEVAGAFQLADQIRAVRGSKPIAAIAGDMAASAAYLIASAADSVSVTPTAVVGSIGVVTSHVDMSRAMDAAGLTVTYIHAGAHKVDGNPLQPLPPDVAAQIQADVNYYYDLFVAAVAANRPALDAAAVRATDARLYIGPQAVVAGLADRIETPDQAIARLAAQISNPHGAARARGKSMSFFNFGKKRLALDISVSDPDVPDDPTSTPDDPTSTPAEESAPAATVPTPPPAATPTAEPVLSVVTVVHACNAAGMPRLAELAIKTPHTQAQLDARIAQAKAVRAVCATAGLPDLADGLIAQGVDESAAKVATWDALAARSTQTPVDATPPAQKQTMRRADFSKLPPADARAFIAGGGRAVD